MTERLINNENTVCSTILKQLVDMLSLHEAIMHGSLSMLDRTFNNVESEHDEQSDIT